MANKYTNELYEKIKGSFSDKKKGQYRNVLKTTPENTYVVRLIPNVDDAEKTLFQYYLHGWSSSADGRYISTVCPSTYDEECPICQERFRLWNKGDETSKELSKNLARKERFYANVYVVDDPINPENNGTVKILGYGRQIAKIIEEAMNGDDSSEIGKRMFDFTKEGCNLRIKVEKNAAGFPSYERSKFLNPSNISVDIDTVMSSIHDFDPLLIRKTTSEMTEMINIGLYDTVITEDVKVNNTAITVPTTVETVDDIPMEFDEVTENDILTALDDITE